MIPFYVSFCIRVNVMPFRVQHPILSTDKSIYMDKLCRRCIHTRLSLSVLYLRNLHKYLQFLIEIHIKDQNLYCDDYSKRVYDINCGVTSTSFQTLVGKIFEMAVSSTLFMRDTITMFQALTTKRFRKRYCWS